MTQADTHVDSQLEPGPEVRGTNARTGVPGEVVAEQTSGADLEAVVSGAVAAGAELADLGRIGRADLLEALGASLEAHRERIVAVADVESGLGEARLNGELTRTIYQLQLFAGALREGSYLEATIDHAADTPMGPRPDLRRIMVPLGRCVAVFGASNFPLAFSVAGGDTASALAAGSAVVVKAHPSHPGTSVAVHAALEQGRTGAGLQQSPVSLVFGLDAGIALVQHPQIKAVGFTGSIGGGRGLAEAIGARPDPIPLFAELGSVNPLLITERAAAERADQLAEGLAGSITLGSGQFCTKPGLIFVPAGADGDRLVDALAAQFAAKSGQVALNQGIANRYAELVRARQAPVLAEATQTGDAPPASETAQAVEQVLLRPRLDQVAAADLGPEHYEEVFGPYALVVRYADRSELAGALADLDGTLTLTLQLADGETDVADLVELATDRAGRVLFNGFPTGVAVSWAQQHGGPWPAATGAATSVGLTAIGRFLRPVTYQDAPAELLPAELREADAGVPRRIDGELVLPAPA